MAGFVIFPDENTLVAPDVSFVSSHRVPPAVDQEHFARLAPDLVVEVMSPSDRMTDARRKIALYLEAGVQVVWLVEPGPRTISVFQPDHSPRRLAGDEIDSSADNRAPLVFRTDAVRMSLRPGIGHPPTSSRHVTMQRLGFTPPLLPASIMRPQSERPRPWLSPVRFPSRSSKLKPEMDLWELIDGEPIAMTPSAGLSSMIASRIWLLPAIVMLSLIQSAMYSRPMAALSCFGDRATVRISRRGIRARERLPEVPATYRSAGARSRSRSPVTIGSSARRLSQGNHVSARPASHWSG